MPLYELNERKTTDALGPGDYIIVDNDFWQVVKNFNVLGCGRMLVLAYHSHKHPKAYKFLEIKYETYHDAYKRKS